MDLTIQNLLKPRGDVDKRKNRSIVEVYYKLLSVKWYLNYVSFVTMLHLLD